MINPRLALRTLLKAPFVTAVAVVSLALGIGANAAIFSLFDQLLLRRLPVMEPDRLVNLAPPGPNPGNHSCNQAGDCQTVFTYPMFRDLEQVKTVFTGIAAHRLASANVAYHRQTQSGEMAMVSGSYFPLLGVQPSLGRLLDSRDDRTPGQSPVAVLNHEYWQTRLGGNPAVIGDTIVVNNRALTIVGVAPAGFRGTTVVSMPLLFVPITMRNVLRSASSDIFNDRRNYWIYLFARLKPGVSLEQASAAINLPYHHIINDVEAPLQKDLSAATLQRFKARRIVVTPGAHGQSFMEREGRMPLMLLMGVTGLVLLIACANIANLLLARAATRSGEMAVRLSIGAGRWHLVSQLLTESCMLALAGGAAGLLVARWTLHLIAGILPPEALASIDLSLEPRVLAFAAILTLGTGLFFGLFPALHATRPDLASVLKGQAGQPSGARAAARFRGALVVAQMMLSMTLLVTSGLFIKSLFNISRVEVGLQPDNVALFTIAPRGYPEARTRELFERVGDGLRTIPGVTSVTAASLPLLDDSNWTNDVAVDGFVSDPDTDVLAAQNAIAEDFFPTLGIPLLAGREFTRADALETPRVAIVNEAFCRKFNLGRNPVGRRIGHGRTGKLNIEIVGLMRDTKYSEVKKPVPPQYFTPYRQEDGNSSLTFYLRTALDPAQTMPAVRRAVARVDAELPVDDLKTMPQQIRDNIFVDRFITVLSAAFALLATLLAGIGLYGVLAYAVAQRTREIGLRMAIGAAPSAVWRMVLRQVAALTIVGGVIGLAAGIGLGMLAASLLFEMKGWDPPVLVAAVVALGLVALGAGFFPALRASRIDPMKALRYE